MHNLANKPNEVFTCYNTWNKTIIILYRDINTISNMGLATLKFAYNDIYIEKIIILDNF